MRFGDVPVAEAEGAILAHALKRGGVRFKKGRRLTAGDIATLRAEGVTTVVAATLDPGDVAEDEAAAALAAAMDLAGVTVSPPATGRVNLHAAEAGLFCADKALVDRLNAIDPAITFACLADHVAVDAGAMVATIKIIPLAVSGAALAAAREAISAPRLVAVKPFRPHRTGLVATLLPTLKDSVMDKTADLMGRRLAASGSALTREMRVAHTVDAVAGALSQMVATHDLLVVFGASAVVDSDDVIPAAIHAAGGVVEQVGMPVDPGNLLVLGRIGTVPVIGAPGCARSPKENGFDWILARILAGEHPTRADISALGVGGLLMEIASRPQPREPKGLPRGPVEIVLLAAGQASRMGAQAGHKLLSRFGGEPLIRRLAREARSSIAARVHVVVGHRAAAIAEALDGLDVTVVENPDYRTGMASSLAAGVGSVSRSAGGALVMLGDMPGIGHAELDALIAAFEASDRTAIVRACHAGRRGNPVVLPRSVFPAARRLAGDVGARALVESGDHAVLDVEIGPAAHLDVDTPEAVLDAGGVLET